MFSFCVLFAAKGPFAQHEHATKKQSLVNGSVSTGNTALFIVRRRTLSRVVRFNKTDHIFSLNPILYNFVSRFEKLKKKVGKQLSRIISFIKLGLKMQQCTATTSQLFIFACFVFFSVQREGKVCFCSDRGGQTAGQEDKHTARSASQKPGNSGAQAPPAGRSSELCHSI